MPTELDVRGLLCPIPAIRARALLASLPADELLIVRADDPEAPIDLAAVAADFGRSFVVAADPDGRYRITLA